MAGSVNKVILVGHLGADPEVRSFQTGGRVGNFSLATSESWKDRQTGERKERTEWHRVSILADGLVGVAERYLRKGSKVYVEGQLRTRKWTDQAGVERWATEIQLNGPRAMLVLLDGKDKVGGGGPAQGGGGIADTGPDNFGDLDDEVPF